MTTAQHSGGEDGFTRLSDLGVVGIFFILLDGIVVCSIFTTPLRDVALSLHSRSVSERVVCEGF